MHSTLTAMARTRLNTFWVVGSLVGSSLWLLLRQTEYPCDMRESATISPSYCTWDAVHSCGSSYLLTATTMPMRLTDWAEMTAGNEGGQQQGSASSGQRDGTASAFE